MIVVGLVIIHVMEGVKVVVKVIVLKPAKMNVLVLVGEIVLMRSKFKMGAEWTPPMVFRCAGNRLSRSVPTVKSVSRARLTLG